MTTVTKIIKISLLSITLCGVINSLQGATCGLNVAGSKPNILVISADDQGTLISAASENGMFQIAKRLLTGYHMPRGSITTMEPSV
tara:strand:+ start:79 stop:336 length:258 start_codon:yes stop_codon:yes gene_type:complete